MSPDEYAELSRKITRQFNQALAGERPVFCDYCGRPFKARETTKFGDTFRRVEPYRHSLANTRMICPGSHQHAMLNPKKPPR